MIRHIVMFKLKDFHSESKKMAASKEIIQRLDELPLKIDVIRRYKAGIDVRKLNWSYDIVLEMDFETMADLDAYTMHPLHQEFIVFNQGYSIARSCIDFEIEKSN